MNDSTAHPRPRIVVWGINYTPELTGIAPYNKILCEYLAQAGFEVEMVTAFAYYPAWKKAPEDSGRIYRTDVLNGIPVHRCGLYVPEDVTALNRILHEASFICTSFLRLLTLRRPALYLVISPPLAAGFAAWILSRLKGSAYIFHVQDLQPDAAVRLGMLKSGLFVRLLFWLEKIAYAKARAVSGISKGMLSAFTRKGVPAEKLIYFPNPVSITAQTTANVARGLFRREHGMAESDFLVVYSGNLGVKQGIEVAAEAARFLTDKPIKLVICGQGAMRDQLAEMLQQLSLKNVTLLPLLPVEQYHQMLHDADVCLITQQTGSGNAFFPSKLLATLALGKPVVTVADEESELNRAIVEGGFGINILPGNPEALANTLLEMAQAPQRLEAFSDAGRRFVAQFEAEKVLSDLASELRRRQAP